jgi:hypothetical protein
MTWMKKIAEIQNRGAETKFVLYCSFHIPSNEGAIYQMSLAMHKTLVFTSPQMRGLYVK